MVQQQVSSAGYNTMCMDMYMGGGVRYLQTSQDDTLITLLIEKIDIFN